MKKLYWILAVLLGITLIACGTGPANQNATQPAGGPIVVTQTTAAAETNLTAADFEPSIKIKKKDCFGGYGCNLTYEVKIATDKPKLAKSTRSYEVTYEVTGGTDGAKLGTVVIDPDGGYLQFDDFAQVRNKTSKLTVKVTEVERMAY